jgi:hypothetical protein
VRAPGTPTTSPAWKDGALQLAGRLRELDESRLIDIYCAGRRARRQPAGAACASCARGPDNARVGDIGFAGTGSPGVFFCLVPG